MAYEVTATRKRPQRFEDLAGQEFVVSTLKNAIEQGRTAHAYLFSGPRGVGKTTSARLLAKALNCVHGPTAEPCGVCDNCTGITKGSSLDVIEIDGASNTGVNDVRVIKEEVLFPPASSKYKIYIIDEVHMLSQSAFNALLKTIEEPPEYVIFIFATTETQKVPATIRSRCQQFNFQLIPLETIKNLLLQAANEMGIEAEDEALFWIAKEATGSMRDAYTLFDQVVAFSNGKITLSGIREKLGLVGIDRINDILRDILAKNGSSAMHKVHVLLSKGVSIEQIIKDFTEYFRSLLLIKKGIKSENIIGERISGFPEEIRNAFNEEQLEAALDLMLNLYRDIRYSLNPRFELELAVSKLLRLRYVASTASIIEQLARLKNDLITGTITPLNPVLADMKTVEPEAASETQVAQKDSSRLKETPRENRSWTKEELKAFLPQGAVEVENSDNGLVIIFNSKFYYKMAYKDIENIRAVIQKKTASDVNVILSYSEKQEEPEAEESKEEEIPASKPKAETETENKIPALKAEPAEEAGSCNCDREAKDTDSPLTLNKMNEEQKNLINDLILCFDGREER